MNDQLTPKTTHSSDQPRRPWRRRLVLATLVGGLAAGIGATELAHGGPGGWLADVDATDAQQKQVAEIMTTTMRELAPLREKHRAARKQVVEILSKPQIDRAALESIRTEELQLAETFSRRITQSLADAAEVLTPDQRAKLAERMERRHGPRRG